jgi:hypothetical protein
VLRWSGARPLCEQARLGLRERPMAASRARARGATRAPDGAAAYSCGAVCKEQRRQGAGTHLGREDLTACVGREKRALGFRLFFSSRIVPNLEGIVSGNGSAAIFFNQTPRKMK